MFREIKITNCIVTVLSSAFLAFGLYQVHSLSGVTEGGVIGLNLLLDHWFRISPSITNFIANVVCYLLGWKLLGRTFLLYSAVATVSFSAFYAVIEQYAHLWPQLAQMPLLASVLGAVFVGIGCGFCVKAGGAVSGDDALAMCLSHVLHIGMEKAYLMTDLSVLALSLSYIPLRRIGYSLLTVLLSGQIIGLIQRMDFSRKPGNGYPAEHDLPI